MYAVIETGGKQYRVQPGDFVQIEKLDGDVGSAVKFDKVLLVAKPSGSADAASTVWLGKPVVAGAVVTGEVVGQGRGDKLLVFKMKRRKQYRRTYGHRQEQTQILVTGIVQGAEKAELSAADKKSKISAFFTNLAPKGGKVKAEVAAVPAEKAPAAKETKKPARKPAAKKTTSA